MKAILFISFVVSILCGIHEIELNRKERIGGWIAFYWNTFGVPANEKLSKVVLHLSASSKFPQMSQSPVAAFVLSSDPYYLNVDPTVSLNGTSATVTLTIPESISTKGEYITELKFAIWYLENIYEITFQKVEIYTSGSSSSSTSTSGQSSTNTQTTGQGTTQNNNTNTQSQNTSQQGTMQDNQTETPSEPEPKYYTLKINKDAANGWTNFLWSSIGVPTNEKIIQVDVAISTPYPQKFDSIKLAFSGSDGSWNEKGFTKISTSYNETLSWEFSSSQSENIDRGNDLMIGCWENKNLHIDSITLKTREAKLLSNVKSSEIFEEVKIDACPTLKKIDSGVSGHGYATRYWDCCKPSCSWTKNAGAGNEARSCKKDGTILTNLNAVSVCKGGEAMTCTSQIPFMAEGCDTIGFGFAAVPGNNLCGRCFLLTFDGNGKYSTNDNHQKIKGKQMVVMASNIGHDVSGGQFDLMIPGGGVGIFNGCADIFGNNLGAQYGGLLSQCNNNKECLIYKCNEVFANHKDAREGCLFLGTFMEGADNPTHDYYEVECPDFLKNKY